MTQEELKKKLRELKPSAPKANSENGVDAVKITGRTLGEWVWCCHCGRCYQVGEFRVVHDKLMARVMGKGDLQMCPYPDCDGDTVLDASSWCKVREQDESWPEVPERGVQYEAW